MFLPGQRAGLFLLFFLFSLPGLTQYKYREIRHPKDKDLVFPVFTNANKAAAKSINEILQIEFFETTIYQTVEQKLFDGSRFIQTDSISQSGYTSLSYKIELNNAKILSVLFEAEAMGAYPTYYRRYFSFDAKSGRPISAVIIFTNDGLNKVKEILIEKRNKEIKETVDELRNELGPNYSEDSSFIADTFTECNARPDENNLFIGRGKILFYKEDCFPHALLSYNANLDVAFTYKELEKYLSPLGKKLLLTK